MTSLITSRSQARPSRRKLETHLAGRGNTRAVLSIPPVLFVLVPAVALAVLLALVVTSIGRSLCTLAVPSRRRAWRHDREQRASDIHAQAQANIAAIRDEARSRGRRERPWPDGPRADGS